LSDIFCNEFKMVIVDLTAKPRFFRSTHGMHLLQNLSDRPLAFQIPPTLVAWSLNFNLAFQIPPTLVAWSLNFNLAF